MTVLNWFVSTQSIIQCGGGGLHSQTVAVKHADFQYQSIMGASSRLNGLVVKVNLATRKTSSRSHPPQMEE